MCSKKNKQKEALNVAYNLISFISLYTENSCVVRMLTVKLQV